jgi:hypothetical protein
MKEQVIERFAACFGSVNGDFQALHHFGLSNIFIEAPGAQSPVPFFFVRRGVGRDDTFSRHAKSFPESEIMNEREQ